jgi:hypothetical protein
MTRTGDVDAEHEHRYDELHVEGEHTDDDDDEGSKEFNVGQALCEEYVLLPSCELSLALSFTSPDLVSLESRLRERQLEAHLVHLRRLLCIRQSVYIDKRRNSVAQKANTRSVSRLAEHDRKIDSVSNRYRAVRAIMSKIDSEGSWSVRLRELADADIRPISWDQVDNVGAEDEEEDECAGDSEAVRRGKKKKKRF